MTAPVVVLNGASSSGKSTIARALQTELLPEPWLTLGVDTLIDAMPPSLGGPEEGLDLQADGTIHVGPAFRRLEDAWYRGLATMVRAGARLIVDEVFLGGAASQERLRDALGSIDALWVGVRCAPDEALRRERARGDRVVGQAAAQADLVHQGVRYDLEVDTTVIPAAAHAAAIAARLRA